MTILETTARYLAKSSAAVPSVFRYAKTVMQILHISVKSLFEAVDSILCPLFGRYAYDGKYTCMRQVGRREYVNFVLLLYGDKKLPFAVVR